MRYLGKTAKRVRKRLGWTQAELAEALQITPVQLSKIENDRAMPSPKLIAKYREVANVDLYVLDWCENPDATALPEAVREAAVELRNAWLKEFS